MVLQITRKILGPDSHCPGKYVNQAPVSNKLEALLLEPVCSVSIQIDTVLEKSVFIILVTPDHLFFPDIATRFQDIFLVIKYNSRDFMPCHVME